MASSPNIERRTGQDDHTIFEVVGRPDPLVRIEPVGSMPTTVWSYRYDQRGDPAPEDFDRVGTLEVTLVAGMPDWDGDVLEAAEDVHDAIVDLKEAMCDARDLDEEWRQEIMMGNLDALPEVEKRVE